MRKPSPARQRTLDLQGRALAFSVAVNAACPARFPDPPSETVWGQLVPAADSASNNLLEADDASGDADFVYKMRVALREAKESRLQLSTSTVNSPLSTFNFPASISALLPTPVPWRREA